MAFEFDPAKSAANWASHGIAIDKAQALWGNPWLLEVLAKTDGAPRNR